MSAEADTTDDTLFDGALRLRQPARKKGYRVNVDALLLAAFAGANEPVREDRARRLLATGGATATTAVRRVRHAVDLGAGVGAVGLALLHLGAAARVTFVEIEPELAALAAWNAEANGWAERAQTVNADVRAAMTRLRAGADLVVCNPPYVSPGRGRVPAVGRGARVGDLDVFLRAARAVAGRRARIAFVYPAIEATTLLTSMRALGLEPKRLRLVHARITEPARVVLVEAAAGKPGGLVIEPPLVELEGPRRSAELAALLTSPRA
ncbi:MAG: methyltransferase [Labilithrix sp.]|nr:methyltransferase [Labilithrix sp.]MCW5813943.1 methyltransferase [Labilithrix sp.]